MKRKIIEKGIEQIDLDFFEYDIIGEGTSINDNNYCTIDNFIKWAESVKDKGASHIRVDKRPDYGNEAEGELVAVSIYSEPEEEYQRRLQMEETKEMNRKAKIELKERQEYLRLKGKFEK